MILDLSFIYWASVVYNLMFVGVIFATCLGVVALALFLIAGLEENRHRSKYVKAGIGCSIGSFIFCLVSIFIPSKDYIMAAGIAKNISMNENYIEDKVTSSVDYILDAIKNLQGKND